MVSYGKDRTHERGLLKQVA